MIVTNSKISIGSLVLALVMLAAIKITAAEPSPVGLWRTIDDQTGQPKGLVRIREVDGQLVGKVEKAFPKPGEDPAPKCEKCDGPRHNQPVLGMTILWGLTQQGEEYQGGGGR